ncbi:MAG: urease accessory protein UreD [Pseudomonadota bacterium]
MPWHAQLDLDYSLEDGRCVARHKHTGPLRILQNLYPEGDDICHNVLVHPPGGLVGGDTLDIGIRVNEGAHGLVTTPGATRFYRSDSEPALQRTSITVDAGARLEWLPLEALCYSGCLAENQLRINVAPGAELLGWDVTALGLPAAGKPFESGSFCQHIEVPGLWLERAHIKAADGLLMDSPLGMAGHRCLATLFFVTGSKLDRQRRQSALDIARGIIDAHPLCTTSGATSPDGQVVLVRVLAPVVEPAMALLREVWLAWRSQLWGLPSSSPRIWST